MTTIWKEFGPITKNFDAGCGRRSKKTYTLPEVEERIKNRKKELDSSNKELNTVKQKLGQERKNYHRFGIVRKMTNQKVKVKIRPRDRKWSKVIYGITWHNFLRYSSSVYGEWSNFQLKLALKITETPNSQRWNWQKWSFPLTIGLNKKNRKYFHIRWFIGGSKSRISKSVADGNPIRCFMRLHSRRG
jgi:hypothetical protein